MRSSRLKRLRCFALVAVMPMLGSASPQKNEELSSIVTLWANDEPRSALNFDTGSYASEISDGQLVLDGAQIVFHQIQANQLTTGFSNAFATRLVDLGDLKVEGFSRVSDQAPHPPISIFHTLYLQGRSVWYRGPVARNYSLKAAEPVFFTLQTGNPQSFVPELGHVYLLRYASKREAGVEEKLVKFRVIDYEPGRQVTIRWARMK